VPLRAAAGGQKGHEGEQGKQPPHSSERSRGIGEYPKLRLESCNRGTTDVGAVNRGSGDALRPVRVLIVDDYALFGESVRLLLDRDARVDVVGVALDAHEAIELALEHDAQVVIMDVSLPGMDGLEATRRLAELKADARVIVTSGLDREGLPEAARAAGAWAFCTKDVLGVDLAGRIAEIAQRPERGAAD
jgi:CheY-like chemotaxis protein